MDQQRSSWARIAERMDEAEVVRKIASAMLCLQKRRASTSVPRESRLSDASVHEYIKRVLGSLVLSRHSTEAIC